MSLTDQIAALIASVGGKLYDIETVSESGRKIYRVYVDREGGADIELCAKISRLISPLLDITPPIEGEYALEGSSPGIERRLRTVEHFQGAIGEKIKLTLRDKTKVKGKLLEVGDGFITIDDATQIDLNLVAKARVVYRAK